MTAKLEFFVTARRVDASGSLATWKGATLTLDTALAGLSGVLYQYAGASASLWRVVVLAAAAGFGAMLLPPVTSEVDWSGAKGDD